MNEIIAICEKCGSENDPDNRFCSFCGSNIAYQKKILSSRIKISIRWVIFTIISVFIFEYIFASAAGQIFIFAAGENTFELETSFLVTSIGSLAGIFTGTLYSSYMSPGFSLKEPIIGASIEILISQIILLIMAGTFSYLFIVRIAVIMIIALAGAICGDKIQKRMYQH